ncbi:prolyl-tRNA synthetase associated domain-containing protein 1 isoform X2 [Alligator mississippiensis]|uniref:prolyl-tRNA synthetase associated domain-containing protein 1 isoform X2 n=1 Tax=Alligator mississippiensis TaxID=8496 RepID=UPI0028780738|nr:prolyl-tRNA synthetase associated domain-containing protein 1 isoform X2 [Alligator mississippiensis]
MPGSTLVRGSRGETAEVFTVEELMRHVGHLGGGHSKNLFLRDKKKKGLWLVTALHDRQVNLNDLGKKLGLGSGTLRFADEKVMQEKLKVGQGCATPLALFCDTGGDVRLVLDAGFLDGGYDRVYFHPMTNAATMGLTPEDFLRIFKILNLLHFPVPPSEVLHNAEETQKWLPLEFISDAPTSAGDFPREVTHKN